MLFRSSQKQWGKQDGEGEKADKGVISGEARTQPDPARSAGAEVVPLAFVSSEDHAGLLYPPTSQWLQTVISKAREAGRWATAPVKGTLGTRPNTKGSTLLAVSHTSGKWPSQDSNPVQPGAEPWVLTHCPARAPLGLARPHSEAGVQIGRAHV